MALDPKDKDRLEPLRVIDGSGISRPMVEAQDLGKCYPSGDALKDVSFRLRAGQVCGLIGPNGSGKTTLLRILATLTAPSLGTAWVGERDVRSDGAEVRKRIGYMPDVFAGDPELSVDAYLEFFARIWRIRPAESLRRIEDILRLVDLVRLRNVPIGGLSLGSRQRLSIGRVLLHNPDVLLLDEPISGLDPRARVQMREILRELGRMGKTIFISSHILTDLADLCPIFAFLAKGRLAFFGTLEELKESLPPGRWVEAAVEGDAGAARDLLRRQPWVAEQSDGRPGRWRISLADGATPARIAETLVGAGFRLTRLAEVEVDLEEAFLRLTAETGR